MLELYMWAEYARTREGFSELKELLSGEELDEIAKVGTEFRERFKIR